MSVMTKNDETLIHPFCALSILTEPVKIDLCYLGIAKYIIRTNRNHFIEKERIGRFFFQIYPKTHCLASQNNVFPFFFEKKNILQCTIIYFTLYVLSLVKSSYLMSQPPRRQVSLGPSFAPMYPPSGMARP